MSKNPASLIGAGLGLVATAFTGKAAFVLGLAGTLVSKITGFESDPIQKETERSEVSPTYSYSSSNLARIGQVIPMIYGTMAVKPDLFLQSFLDIEGVQSDEIYYSQIFCIGIGDYAIKNILLDGRTNLIGREGFSHEVVSPGNAVSILSDIFRYNSTVIAGSDLPYKTSSGTEVWLGWEVIAEKHLPLYLNIILFFKYGFYNESSSGALTIKVEFAKVEDDGSYVDIVTRNLSISFYSSTAVYRKLRIARPSTYDPNIRVAVRICRTSSAFTGNSKDDVFVVSLNMELLPPYSGVAGRSPDCTLVYMKTKLMAGETIQMLNNITMTVARRIRRRDEVFGWLGVGETSNPIDHLLDLLTNTTYGEGLTDSEIDLVNFDRQKVNANTRGDECNINFDTSINIKDAMASICKTIRSTITINDGVATIVRDEEIDNPMMLFTGDIFKDSLSIAIRTPKQSDYDAVSIRYRSKKTRSEEMVTESGSVAVPVKSKVISIAGISTEEHAKREALHYYNDHHKRFATVTFSVDMEAILLNIGDKIAISHYLLTSTAQHGVLESIDRPTRVFRSRMPFKREFLSPYRVILRAIDGKVAFDGRVTFIDDYRFMIDDVIAITETTYESEQSYTLWRNASAFDTGFLVQIPFNAVHRQPIVSIYKENDSLVNAKVSGLKMLNNHTVEIQAVIDDDMVYS